MLNQMRSTHYIMKFDNNNKKNKHVNFLNKIINDQEHYCYKCRSYETSWCNCKFNCLQCINLGEYLSNRNCHCSSEKKNRFRNKVDDDEDEDEGEDEENFFHYFYFGDNFENSTICHCPICEVYTAEFNISFQFEPYQGSYDTYNKIKVTCSNCGFKYDQTDSFIQPDNDIYDTGLYKYKVFLENKLEFEDPSEIIMADPPPPQM